jgi:hypothetical protein
VFKKRSEIAWYERARGDRSARWIFPWNKPKLAKFKARLQQFEKDSQENGGKLLFTATDILDQYRYDYRNLDIGYVALDQIGQVYCFQSGLALKDRTGRDGGRREDIYLFKLSDEKHYKIPGMRFYHKVYEEIVEGTSLHMFFENPSAVWPNLRASWVFRRNTERTVNFINDTFKEIIHSGNPIMVIIRIVLGLLLLIFILRGPLSLLNGIFGNVGGG